MSYCVMILTTMSKEDKRVCTDRCSDWFDNRDKAVEYATCTMKLKTTDMAGVFVNNDETAYFGIAAR